MSSSKTLDTENKRIFRVGIIGCGNIAEQHLKFLMELDSVQVVGLADASIQNANALGNKYGITARYDSLEALLTAQKIDVLHVCTPPAFHYSQARLALEHGIHVFLEKPLTFQADQLTELYKLAVEKRVILCPNFLQLFLPCLQEAQDLMNSAGLGQVIQVECFYGFDAYSTDVYRTTGLPWSFGLPGGLFHNHLTHPLYLVLNFIGAPRSVQVSPHSFGVLPQGLTDHVNILLEGKTGNAQITLSVVPKTSFYSLRLVCQNGTITVDLHRLNVVLDAKGSQPNAIHRFLSNYGLAWQLFKANTANIWNIVRGRVVSYQGMQKLLAAFYQGLAMNAEAPISPELAIGVVRAEELVAAKIEKTQPDLSVRLTEGRAVAGKRILVTGASGFLGQSITRELICAGYAVRAYVRPLSQIDSLQQAGAEIVFGDIRDCGGLMSAAADMDYIVHAAAGMRGPRDVMLETSLAGVENIAQAARALKIKKVVYISSTGIYDYTKIRNGGFITEESLLESDPEARGGYTFAKCRAEEVALGNLADPDVAWSILRPSILFGTFRPVHTLLAGAMVGNLFVYFGSPRNYLRLVHTDDVGVAVVKILENSVARGQVYNVSHPEAFTVGQYFKQIVPTELGRRIRVIYVPQFVMSTVAGILGLGLKLFKKGPTLNPRQLTYWYRNCRVNPRRIQEELGWQPKAVHILDCFTRVNR